MNSLRVGVTLLMMYRNEGYTITDYDALDYLITNGLIEENNRVYTITPSGLEFLDKYLQNNLLSLSNHVVSNNSNKENKLPRHYVQACANNEIVYKK